MRYHLSVPTQKAIKELKKGNNLFEPATINEALKQLLNHNKPYYVHCDNQTPEGRCAGHRSK